MKMTSAISCYVFICACAAIFSTATAQDSDHTDIPVGGSGRPNILFCISDDSIINIQSGAIGFKPVLVVLNL